MAEAGYGYKWLVAPLLLASVRSLRTWAEPNSANGTSSEAAPDPEPSSTVSELTLWSSAPPHVPWPALADDPVLDSLTAPLCDAYIASCP